MEPAELVGPALSTGWTYGVYGIGAFVIVQVLRVAMLLIVLRNSKPCERPAILRALADLWRTGPSASYTGRTRAPLQRSGEGRPQR